MKQSWPGSERSRPSGQSVDFQGLARPRTTATCTGSIGIQRCAVTFRMALAKAYQRQGLTPRQTGAAVAGHLGPSRGTRYILPARATAPRVRGPVSCGVRHRNPHSPECSCAF